MAKIIFATDFSPIAQHAATYAVQLASYLKTEFSLLHTYIIPFAYTDSAVPLLNAEDVKTIATNSIAAEKQRLQALAPDLTIKEKIVPGDLIDCLKTEIEESAIDLIILGSSGDDAESVLWGNIAVKALRSFKIPVLTIPAKANWKPITQIAFAADYRTITANTPFTTILDWSKKMQSKLSVVHIDNPSEPTMQAPEILQNALVEILPTYHSVSTENIITGVQDFIERNQIDWLILIPRKFGFWASLFHRSKTKMLAQVSHIPILSLHQE